MTRIKPSDQLHRAQDLPSTQLDKETILMSVEAGAYFGFEGTAQFIWEALADPITMTGLLERIAGEFDVEPAACRADVEHFLNELLQEGLLRVA